MPAPVAAAAGRAAAGASAAGAGSKAAGASAGGAKAASRGRRGGAGGAAGDVAAPTKADNKSLRTELGARDAAYQTAYEMGQRGEPLGELADDQERAAWETGAAERERDRRGRVLEGVRQAPGAKSAGGMLNDGAGFLLGLVGYALVLNYLQGGAAQAHGWMAAKFLNRPYGATAARAPAKAGPAAQPSGPSPQSRAVGGKTGGRL